MTEISKADALKIASRWEQERQPIFIFCFSSAVVLSSKNGRIALCLDECLDLLLAGEGELRIFTAGAIFSTVAPEDFPLNSVHLPTFKNGLRVDFQSKQMQWLLLA